MPVDWLFTWWNAIYSVPLLFVLLLLAITSIFSLVGGTLGELMHGDAHADHDVHLDHGDAGPDLGASLHHDSEIAVAADAGVDVDADVDVDLDGDGDIDAVDRAIAVAQGGGHAGGNGLLVGALVALGVGRAPLVMLIQILLLLWGLLGVGLHQTFGATGPSALAWSLPVTLLLSVLGTRTFALLFGRFFKSKETYALRRNEMVGRTGRVVFPVTGEAGTVHIRDQHGTLHRLRARTPHGKLDCGRQIIVVGYDPQQSVYEVDDASSFVDRP